jgi:hypothetical protein
VKYYKALKNRVFPLSSDRGKLWIAPFWNQHKISDFLYTLRMVCASGRSFRVIIHCMDWSIMQEWLNSINRTNCMIIYNWLINSAFTNITDWLTLHSLIQPTLIHPSWSDSNDWSTLHGQT